MDLTPLFTGLDFHRPSFAFSALAKGTLASPHSGPDLSGRRATTTHFASSKMSSSRWPL